MLSAAACLPSACPGCAFCPSAASSHCPGPPPPSCPEYVFTSWHPADGALLHAIDLRSGAVKSFRAPPFFVFHWANAFHTQGGRWGGVGEWGRVGVLEEAWERLQNSSSMKEATSSCWTCVHRWLAQQGTRNRALPCAPPPPPPPPPFPQAAAPGCLPVRGPTDCERPLPGAAARRLRARGAARPRLPAPPHPRPGRAGWWAAWREGMASCCCLPACCHAALGRSSGGDACAAG